ncbi:MAG: OsmC family protein [Candidatus Nanohaloarchaea archaeon]
MVKYPLEFESETKATEEEKRWETRLSDEELDVSVPEEFGGEETAASPEQIFVAALENCVVATFKTIAERKQLKFDSIESESNAVLDRAEDSRPMIEEAQIVVKVSGVENEDKADQVRQAAIKNCFIHRSVKTDIEEEFRWE